jgi:hypothetical protein
MSFANFLKESTGDVVKDTMNVLKTHKRRIIHDT